MPRPPVGKSLPGNCFFHINDEILKRNNSSLWKAQGLFNVAKFFYGRPERSEKTQTVLTYKLDRKTFDRNSHGPSCRSIWLVNFTIVSTALKIAGYGRISHKDYDILLTESGYGNFVKNKVKHM